MTRLMILSTVVVATLGLAACGSDNVDSAYLGSRDDIIVNNRNMPKEEVVKAETAMAEAPKEIETVKVDADEMAKMEAEKQRIAAQEKVIADAKMNAEKAAPDESVKAMKTTPKGIVEEKSMPTTEMPSEVAAEKMASSTTSETVPETVMPTAAVVPTNMQGDVPPNAKPGECYAKVLIPAVKETQTKRVQISEEQKVLARIVPAKYDVQKERVLVREARQYWKAGKGPITKKDQVTGEIMCLVEEPAEYKTIEKRILVEPEKPEYKMVPAQFETVTKTNIVTPETWEWRRILCETNMGTSSIIRIQQALNKKGYNIAIDGKLGDNTMSALNAYQQKNGLATRGITYETLSHLGVELIGA